MKKPQMQEIELLSLGKQSLGKQLRKTIKSARRKALVSPYLKKRVSIICDCESRKRNEKDRVKFGTCSCDSYSMKNNLGKVIANYLYQYLADAKHFIKRDDWDKIEKHAEAINEYANADSWDTLSKEKGVKSSYLRKEHNFKMAMKWLANNWDGLWW